MSKISSALDKFKARYAGRVQVAEKAVNVSSAFSSTKSRMVKKAVQQGQQVYALAISGGKGMLEKWKMKGNGLVERGQNRKPVFKKGPKQLAAMFLCSPKTMNIGSDEILVGKEKSIQGVRREEALAVFTQLGLNPKRDAYVLFVRRPQEIASTVRAFRETLSGIFEKGGRWRPAFRFRGKLDRRFIRHVAGQLAAQVHPSLRGKIVADFFGPEMMKDPWLRKQALEPVRKAKRRWK